MNNLVESTVISSESSLYDMPQELARWGPAFPSPSHIMLLHPTCQHYEMAKYDGIEFFQSWHIVFRICTKHLESTVMGKNSKSSPLYRLIFLSQNLFIGDSQQLRPSFSIFATKSILSMAGALYKITWNLRCVDVALGILHRLNIIGDLRCRE